LKPFAKSTRTKQYHSNPYIVPKGPSKERRGEQAKVEINAFQFKVTYVSRWKSLIKEGKLTLANGWKV